MGLGDNRRSPKMRRKVAQSKLKARIKRRRDAAAKTRAQHKTTHHPTPSPAVKKGSGSKSSA